jgi:phospholipase C
VYQEEDNYDDNVLAWFKQIASASAASPLWQRGMRKGTAGWFETDARAGRLPQVSWLVAPTAQTEHPSFFPAAGAEYIASKLDAIASNEDLRPRPGCSPPSRGSSPRPPGACGQPARSPPVTEGVSVA